MAAWGGVNFFNESSIEQLAAEQNVSPLVSADQLCGGFPADENIDDFLRDIYESRR